VWTHVIGTRNSPLKRRAWSGPVRVGIEQRDQAEGSHHVVVRTGLTFGPDASDNQADTVQYELGTICGVARTNDDPGGHTFEELRDLGAIGDMVNALEWIARECRTNSDIREFLQMEL
jgi:hypothetical protein